MEANFYEQLVKKENITSHTVAIVFAYIYIALAIMALLVQSYIPLLIFVVLAILIFVTKGKLYTEYEYIFTNGDIDIDRIVEQKKRKRMLSFNLSEVQLITEVNSEAYKNFSNKPEKRVKYYIKNTSEKVYVAMITGGTNRAQLFFTPNEIFLDHCYRKSPRIVKKN